MTKCLIKLENWHKTLGDTKPREDTRSAKLYEFIRELEPENKCNSLSSRWLVRRVVWDNRFMKRE